MRQSELKVTWLPLDSLKAYDNNAKQHTNAQIDAVQASIMEFGFRNPIIVWHNADGVPEIVAGHARATAAEKLGMETVPCVTCDDLTDAQRRALTLADNQTTMMTGWDEDTLAYELDVLAESFNMADFGFDLEGMGDFEVFQEKIETQTDIPSIQCNGKRYQITQDEADMFCAAYDAYLDREGVSFGFITEKFGADAD